MPATVFQLQRVLTCVQLLQPGPGVGQSDTFGRSAFFIKMQSRARLHIEENELRPLAPDSGDGILAVCGFVDHVDILVLDQERSYSLPSQWLIIDDYGANLLYDFSLLLLSRARGFEM